MLTADEILQRKSPADDLITVYKDGQPCNYKGCINHVTHPCEGCGRVAGKGKVRVPRRIYDSLVSAV